MKRRDLLKSAGTAGFLSSLGGCTVLNDSSGSTSTPTISKTEKRQNSETKTDQLSDTATSTPSPEAQAAMDKARTELAVAFKEIHSLGFYQGDRLVTDYDKFNQFDPESALSYVKKAREPLSIVREQAENQLLRKRYAVLGHLALLAEEGVKLYDNLRKTFLRTWEYVYAFEHAFYEDAVKQVSQARTFLSELTTHRERVSDALINIRNAPVSPRVDNFNLETWVHIEDNIKERTPGFLATLKGFEVYTEAVIYDSQGLETLDNDDPKAAYESFQKAIKAVNKSQKSFGEAKQREAIFFKSRLDAYDCRAPAMKEAYLFHLQAAEALREGDDEKATDLRERGMMKIGESVDECPISEINSNLQASNQKNL